MRIKTTIIYLTFTSLIFHQSCSDDTPVTHVNLTSDLDIENIYIGNEEGKYLYFNLSLSDPLTQDLIIKGEFTTDNISAYINDDDYLKEFEYSSNNGVTWNKEKDVKSFKFVKNTSFLKVRIPTIEDTKKEIQEQFIIKLTPEDKGFMLTNNLDDVLASVDDNDLSKDNIITDVSDHSGIMEFSFNDDYTQYEIISLAKTVSSPFQKEIIDGGYLKPLEDAMLFYKLIPNGVNVNVFRLIANPESGLGGFVYNNSSGTADRWIMAMNLAFAYFDVSTGKRIEYNDTGFYGNIFTHELGHILTLNNTYQINTKISAEECSNLYVDGEGGCLKDDAHLNLFHQDFYLTPTFNQPTHVSGYAMTNIYEDIAETFSHYVTQETIPASTISSSGALKKLDQIGKGTLENLKSQIRNIYKLGLSPRSEEIFARQVNENGEFLSCLNYDAIKKHLVKNKF